MLSYRSVPYLLVLVLALCTTGLDGQSRIGSEGNRERDPVLTAAGKTLYFTRLEHPRNQGTEDRADIWFRQRTAAGNWGRALNPGSPVNSFGDDRLLGSSVDGNRLAVLREGEQARIELLERAGRSWRVIARWPLPPDVTDTRDMTFNASGQEMVYVRHNPANNSRDLYLRRALTEGKWSAAEPLAWVNGHDHESKPHWAADGRTLYFRRGAGQWYRQTDRATPPHLVDIPSRYLQLAATDEQLVASTDDLGQDEQLVSGGLPPQVLCPPGRITYGTLGNPPAAGSATVMVPLSSGIELRVRPDVLNRYAVVVRTGEVAFPDSNMPDMGDARPAGSLASLGEVASENRGNYLQRTLEDRQRELARLDQLRRQRYTRGNAGPSAAEELAYTEDTVADTLPPAAAADTTAGFRARYARELAELERMKAKFRRQQEDRLRERQRGEYLDLGWSDQSVGADATDTTENLSTDALRSTVRSGLYPDQRPATTSRRPWENDIRQDVARQPAALDDEYARQQRELEALRAQLREMNGTAPTPRPSAARPELTSKSPEAPVTSAPARASRLGVTFIPNTAYPNSAGYTALEALATRVRSGTGVVDIRVHTAPNTDARAAQLLSEERAVTIRNYLREAGIAPANYRVTGFGNHQPEGGERVEVVE